VVPGGSYGSACVYTLGGTDPRSGRRFVHYETVGGGGGAMASGPGAHGIRVHMGNTMNLPIENVEAQIPVRFLEYSILRESGGAGRHAGGCGVRKSLMSLAEGVQASVLGERTDTPARGAAGAQDGARAVSDGSRRRVDRARCQEWSTSVEYGRCAGTQHRGRWGLGSAIAQSFNTRLFP